MKNGLLIWNIVLTLAVGFLLFKQLGSRKTTGTDSKVQSSNSTINSNQPFRIAYFEMDSVAAQFALVKDLEKELKSKEDAINSEMTQRTKDLQEKYNYYQNLLQNGKLPPQQEESARKELERMNEEIKNRKQDLDQNYNSFALTKQNDIKLKIE